MAGSIRVLNAIGAVVAVAINVLLIALFIARLGKKPQIEHGLGIVIILSAVPLSYLFVTAFAIKRPVLYFIQVGLMIAYLLVEFLLDYILKVDFRQNMRIVIPYIMLFFSGTAGDDRRGQARRQRLVFRVDHKLSCHDGVSFHPAFYHRAVSQSPSRDSMDLSPFDG